MDVRIYPSENISGTVSVPVSKSAMHRALICASGTDRKTVIYAKDLSDDIMRTVEALRACGSAIDIYNDRVEITGGPVPEKALIDAGESGSTLRFMISLCAAKGIAASFITEGLLGERPLSGLLEELERHGMSVNTDPLSLSGKLSGKNFVLPADMTSQYVSGLLMALPFTGREAVLSTEKEVTSRGYIDMTLGIMEDFGVKVKRDGYRSFALDGSAYDPPREYVCESDWSGASCILAAAALSGSVSVKGLDPASIQPDRKVTELLAMAGALITVSRDEVFVRKNGLRAFDMSFDDTPDLVPAAAALAVRSEGTSVLRDVGKLRFKESDRIEALTEGFGRLGHKVTSDGDTMYITPGEPAYAEVSSFGDHRIAMALAAASLGTGCLIRDAGCVSKSYPSFWNDLGSLGVKYDKIL